jgi:hypothetical protein
VWTGKQKAAGKRDQITHREEKTPNARAAERRSAGASRTGPVVSSRFASRQSGRSRREAKSTRTHTRAHEDHCAARVARAGG